MKSSSENNLSDLTQAAEVIIIRPIMGYGVKEVPISVSDYRNAADLSAAFSHTTFLREIPYKEQETLRTLLKALGGVGGLMGKNLEGSREKFRIAAGAPVPVVLVSGSETPFVLPSLETVYYEDHISYIISSQKKGYEWKQELTFDRQGHVTRVEEGLEDAMKVHGVATLFHKDNHAILALGHPQMDVPAAEMVMVFDQCQLKEPGFAAVSVLNILQPQ